MNSAPLSLQPESLFHRRYRVVRCINIGGMGSVYEVLDEATNHHRALKVMLPSIATDPELRARFALEAKVTGGVDSDHIVHTVDAGIDEATDSPFLVMEMLYGEDLGALVQTRGALSPTECLTYLHQAALALAKTHAAGIVHRDIKPENLFLTTRDDGTPRIKIADFGVAKLKTSDDAKKTRAVGTPLYMAPEQVRGDSTIGPCTDVYALGQVAYTLLVGEPYWQADQQENDSVFNLLTKVVRGVEEPPNERAARTRGVKLMPGFDAWFAKATRTEPAGRFQSATAAVDALAEVLRVPRPAITPTNLVVPAATEVSDSTTLQLELENVPAGSSPSAVSLETPIVVAAKSAPMEPVTKLGDVTVAPTLTANPKAAHPARGSRALMPAVAFIAGALLLFAIAGLALQTASNASRDTAPVVVPVETPPASTIVEVAPVMSAVAPSPNASGATQQGAGTNQPASSVITPPSLPSLRIPQRQGPTTPKQKERSIF